jgi:hypothetical protein
MSSRHRCLACRPPRCRWIVCSGVVQITLVRSAETTSPCTPTCCFGLVWRIRLFPPRISSLAEAAASAFHRRPSTEGPQPPFPSGQTGVPYKNPAEGRAFMSPRPKPGAQAPVADPSHADFQLGLVPCRPQSRCALPDPVLPARPPVPTDTVCAIAALASGSLGQIGPTEARYFKPSCSAAAAARCAGTWPAERRAPAPAPRPPGGLFAH